MALLHTVGTLLLLARLSQGEDFPFRDPSLSWEERLDDLMGRLTLEEMVLQMARGGARNNGPAPSIERLGIGPFTWNTECLRGDVEAYGWATSYPQALGLAASFSPELIHRVANATATEVRAKHNIFATLGDYRDHTGLTCFSPVLNIMRHPLWGRNQVLLTRLARRGRYGWQLKGEGGSIAGGSDSLGSLWQVEERDWRMTFLPQFEACARAGTFSFMCSYNRINGVPACANKKLLTDILRGEWGFQGYVVSDEGAVELIMAGHHYTHDFLETAIASVNAGCNLELSYGITRNVFMNIGKAVAMGNISLETVRARVRPLFRTRMRLGEFDPPTMNPYNLLGPANVQTEAHRQLALEAAVRSFVLLKNQRGTLPLKAPGKGFAVVGPFADNPSLLFGDYAPIPDPQYIYTPRRGLETISAVRFAAGCTFPRCDRYAPDEVKAAVQAADVVVVCLGTGIDLETEAVDRSDLALPGHQLELLQDAVAWAAGRPVILLLFNAGPLDVSWAKGNESVGAILTCFFPAQAAGLAIAKVLLGAEGTNPAGRLPATWPAGMHQVPPMENYTMVGRTYRYFGDEAPLYPFGYGLSFTSFRYSSLKTDSDVIPICGNLSVSVVVENVGSREGEEVVQLYLGWGSSSVPVPRWQLVGFRRVPVPVNRPVKVLFQVSYKQRAVWAGKWLLEPGVFTLFAGGQQPFQETHVPSNVLQADFVVSGRPRGSQQC
ncbi:hypothetical protein lerEdw1_004968 [Lerista edwardsae]|nr:hypothetical protein lerEdw1_004968 [Lerista edwardsae]